MKSIYKNNEKKQRVRIIATGELGTVTDRVLMKRSGTPMLYYQVKLDSQPNLDRWYWADQLGDTKERCRVTLEDDGKSTYHMDITKDYETDEYTIGLQGNRNNNRPHVHDLALHLMRFMLTGIGCTTEDLINARRVDENQPVLAPPLRNR